MPVDPEISLAAGRIGTPTANPLATVGAFANIQNALNQNRLFQQTFAARQEAGQILSSAPDLETGLNALYQNPLTAPFAGEVINSVRAGQQTLAMVQKTQAETQQVQKNMTDSALQGFMKNLAPVMSDPSQFPAAVSNTLAGLSPTIQARVAPALESIREGLTNGLPSDPAAARQVFNTRLAGWMTAGGVTPESIRGLTGTLTPQVAQVTTSSGASRTMIVGGPVAGAPVGMGTGTGGGGSSNSAPSLLAGNGAASAPAATTAGDIISTGPSTLQQKFLTDRGGSLAAQQEKLDEAVSSGRVLMQTLQEARDAMQSFKPGAGASTYQRIAQIAQAFGASPQLVDDISNGNLAASQEFQKLMVNTTAAQMKQQLGVNGTRYSQMEFQIFQKNNPNIDTDPRAINSIFNFWTKIHQLNVTEQAQRDIYLSKGGDISQWPRVWNEMATKMGLVQLSVDDKGKPTVDPSKAVAPPSNTLTTPPPPAAAPNPLVPGRPSLDQIFH